MERYSDKVLQIGSSACSVVGYSVGKWTLDNEIQRLQATEMKLLRSVRGRPQFIIQ